MIKLSDRLLAIASFVKENSKIVDIGCDHALLDIYLTSKYPHLKAIAIDLREGALNQAHKNIEKYNANNIDLRLGNGLDVITKDEIDTIIMSGLGYYSIIEILLRNKSKLLNVNDLIIQSNTDYYHLRKAICKLGYYIENEKIVKENNIVYLIVHFKKGHIKYSKKEYLYGPCLIKEKSYKKILENELKKKEILYNLIPKKYLLKKWNIKRQILILKNLLRQKI